MAAAAAIAAEPSPGPRRRGPSKASPSRGTGTGTGTGAATATASSPGQRVLQLLQLQGHGRPFQEPAAERLNRHWRGLGTVVELGMSAMAHPLTSAETLELWDAELSAARGTITFEGVHSLQPKFDMRLSVSQLHAELLRDSQEPLLGLHVHVLRMRGLIRPNNVYDGSFSVGALHGDAHFGLLDRNGEDV